MQFIAAAESVTVPEAPEYAEKQAESQPAAADPYEKDEHYLKGLKYRKDGEERYAAHQFRLSAQAGYPMGQFEYGKCLETGFGVRKNYHRAFEYYTMASDGGHSGATAALGRCLLWGRGAEIDKDKAFGYFLKSAEQGDSTGQLWTGYCYQHGIGTETDKEIARQYYELSLAQGNIMALRRIETLG